MYISSEAIDLIKEFESFSAVPYICPGGYNTIGYGHLIKKGETYNKISNIEAEKLLLIDLSKIYKFLITNINVSLSHNQFGALASFSYNVGCAAFQRSTLRMKINNNIFSDVEHEILRWNKASGRVLAGLIRRRNAEVQLFFKK